jgi:amino acid transporter
LGSHDAHDQAWQECLFTDGAFRRPVNAIFTFVGIAGAIIAVWALLHVIGGHSGSMDPINFFVESSTLGTILLLVVYFLSNLALPFYYRKFLPEQFNAVKHLILPVLGLVAIAVPVYYLSKPGQSAVQLVPVRRAGHGDHLGGLRVRAEWPGPVPR